VNNELQKIQNEVAVAYSKTFLEGLRIALACIWVGIRTERLLNTSLSLTFSSVEDNTRWLIIL
jgi:hypothetical protein